jgi:galactokinase
MHDLVTRLDARAELRLVPYAFERAYGRSPQSLWRAPYALRLGGSGLTVAVHWQVVVAVAPRPDGVVRLGSLNRPAEWAEVRPGAPAQSVPEWARCAVRALGAARLPSEGGGMDVLVHADLPEASGLSAQVPIACALAAAAGVPGSAALDEGWAAPGEGWDAVVHGRRGFAVGGGTEGTDPELVPFDLDAAGLRAMLVVTRPLVPAGLAAPAAGVPVGPDLMAGLPRLTSRPGGRSDVALAVERALAGGAVCAWPVGGEAVAVVVPGARRGAVRAGVAGELLTGGRRAPRFLSLRTADGVGRLDG